MNNLLTFNFIDNWSQSSAQHIYNKIKYSTVELSNVRNIIENLKKVKYEDSELTEQSYTELFSYGFKVIYGAIIKGGILLTLALLLNILIPTLVVIASFGIIRVFAGGLHFESYTKCTYISIVFLLMLGVMGSIIPFNNIINIIVFVFTLAMFVSFAPVENQNRPLKDKEKSRFKSITIINLFILLALQSFIDVNIIKESIMFGILLSGFITLPIVNKLK